MEELKTLVERYGNLKKEMDSYKKQVDSDNKAIKEVMSETGITEFTAGGFVAKYSVAVSESFDEDKLLAKLEKMTYVSENGCKGCFWYDIEAFIKEVTKDYVRKSN